MGFFNKTYVFDIRKASKNINFLLAVVFLFYIFVLIIFATLYYNIWLNNPNSFAFNADILKNQSIIFKSSAEEEKNKLSEKLDALNSVLNNINKSYDLIKITGYNLFGSPFESMLITENLRYKFRLHFVPGTMHLPGYTYLKLHYYDKNGIEKLSMNTYKIYDFPNTKQQYNDILLREVNSIDKNIDEVKRQIETLSGPAPEVWSFLDFIYFSAITQATVGYGDMLPNNTLIRMLVVIQLLIGLLLFVVVINIVIAKKIN